LIRVNDAAIAGGENSAMHGEYKMPGGKLVVADFEPRDGLLAGVRISGDFFLEPDHALNLINAALTGHPLSATQEALAAAVHAALGDEVRMYGISAEAVAIAVRRALASTP
jgi:lipoate-protein ligase A